MNRLLVYIFVVVMLSTVVGQAFRLQAYQPESIDEIRLEESRLIPFMSQIQATSPYVYDSIVWNLSRIEAAGRVSGQYQFEEVVVAEKLLQHLDTPQASRAE